MFVTRKTIVEPERAIPVFDEVDVAVIGGGPAGVAASIAAARNGASVALVERYLYGLHKRLGSRYAGGLPLDPYVDRGEVEDLTRGLRIETPRVINNRDRNTILDVVFAWLLVSKAIGSARRQHCICD